MKIKTFGSDSRGNCYHVTDGESGLLLEAGLPWSWIREGLEFESGKLKGILLSHEHGDHSKSVIKAMQFGHDVYMSHGTAKALKVDGNIRARTLKPLDRVKVGTFTVIPFPISHDAAEPFGYCITSDVTDERLLFVTDTSEVKYEFRGIHYLMAECNFCEQILSRNVNAGKVNINLAARIHRNHLSIQALKEVIEDCGMASLREIHLMHLSNTNGDEKRFVSEIQEHTGVPTYVCSPKIKMR